MKKILSFLMIIVMCATMTIVMPNKTNAETTAIDCTQYVYHVSTFDELKSAITEDEYKVNDYKHNRTIILDADIVGSDLTKDYGIIISDGKTVVLDLNNHKIDIVSEKTNVLFKVNSGSKLYFMNGQTRTKQSQGAINFSINNRNDTNSLALVYVNSNNAEFNSYDVNYTMGKAGSNGSYVTKNNYSVVFWLNQVKNVMISGGTILNYHSKGNAIRVQNSSAEINKIEVSSNTVMNTGNSAIVVNFNTKVSKINISDATIKSMNPDVPRIKEIDNDGNLYNGIIINKYIATPYQGSTRATISKVGGSTISPTETVNNIKYDVVFSLIGDNWETCQTYMNKDIIVPAGHIWMCYETNGFANITKHSDIKTIEDNFVDASCAENGSYDKIKYCNICKGIVSKEHIVTDKLPHDFTGNAEKCLECGAKNPDYKAEDTTNKVPTTEDAINKQPTAGDTANQTTKGDVVNSTQTKEDINNSSAEKPKASKIVSLKKAKKAFKVTWKKVENAQGYQIQYSTNKKFKKKTTVTKTYKGNNEFTKTIKKLVAKKKYFVRVRAYKVANVDGKNIKIYSNWSAAKKVKVK